MIQFNSRSLIRLVYILIDIIFICLSFYLACWLRKELLAYDVTFVNLFLGEENPFRSVFLSWTLIAIFVISLNGLYYTRREVSEGVELWLVLKSVITASLAMIVGIYITKMEGFPRSIFILSTLFIVTSLSLWRVVKRMFVEYLVASGYNNFNVLIIGAGKVGRTLAEEISHRPSLGLKVVGFLDDFKSSDSVDSEAKVLGKISDFVHVSRREFVNKVFITIHHDSKVFLQLLEQARDIGVAVRVIPQGFDLMRCEYQKYNIGFIPVLEYGDIERAKKQIGKRLFDFVISFCALLILWPVMVIIAILVKLDSRGPVFYISKRYGRGGRKFNMLKFRSMVQNADQKIDQIREQNEVDGPIFKMKEDPRITSFGRALRKYSLDELPQVINVFIGQMSLVGPRPLPISQVEREDLKQLKRLEVRPGITGLWQIRGRSDLSFSKLLRWDIWYINNWSFWLDWNILLQTVPVVLKCKGAY